MSKHTLEGNHPLNFFPNEGPLIVAVGGGKGGIGKSFISSNLALALAKKQRVCIVDLDLGASNLHTYLGIKEITSTMSDSLFSETPLKNLTLNTHHKNLYAISGALDHLGITEISQVKINQVIIELRKLPFDTIILDLGAGSTLPTVKFFLAAHLSLIVTTPDPASIENAYRFLKTAFYQKIKGLEKRSSLKDVISRIMSHRDQFGIRSPAQLLQQVKIESPLSSKILEHELNHLNMGVVLNQIRSQSETKIGPAIARICKQYFGVNFHYYGAISYDDTVWQSLRRCQPILQIYPQSKVSQEIIHIASHLVGSQTHQAVV